MANIKSAIKRARQNVKCRARNVARRSTMRTHIKKVLAAVESGDRDMAMNEYRSTVSILDKNVHKGIIHAHKAARHKSRLNAKIKQMA